MRYGSTILYTLIVIFWLTMMALLIRDHVLPDGSKSDLLEVSAALLDQDWEDFEEWMDLQVLGKSRGVSYTKIEKVASGLNYAACNRTWLDLGAMAGGDLFRLETVALLDSEFNLRRAKATAQVYDMEMLFLARVATKRLLFRWQLGDKIRVGRQTLDGPISLMNAIRPLVTQRFELKVGQIYRLPVLDSTWSLSRGMAQIRVEAIEPMEVEGKSIDTFRVVTQLGTFATTTWVDRRGQVIRRRFPGLVMERTDPETARAKFKGIDAPIEPPRMTRADFLAPEGEEDVAEQEISPLNMLIEIIRDSSAPEPR